MKRLIFFASMLLAGCADQTSTDTEAKPNGIPTTATRYRKWSAYETNLPKGVVTGGESTNTGNWLSIEREDGMSTVVKDVDPAVWGAVSRFDTIQ